MAGLATELFVDRAAQSRRADHITAARAADVPVHVVGAEVLASIADARTPQGIVAVARWVPPSLDALLAADATGQVALAHRMADPGNAGALIRVADAAGALFVAMSEGSVDPTNPKCVRSTAGSLFHLPVVPVGDTAGAIARLRAAGFRCLAAAVTSDSVDLFTAERTGLLCGRVLWVFGNEVHGLPHEVLAAADHVVRIPILGAAESLNVATAAAVCQYAYARQREEWT